MRRAIWLVVVLVIAVAAVVAVGDVRQLATRLDGFRWSAFAAALALAFANYALRFVRWQVYLRHQALSVPRGTSALVFGAGLSLSITPGKVGELVKSYFLHALCAVPATRSAPIVIAERVTDLIALLLLALAGAAAYGLAPALVLAAATLVLAGLALLAWPRPALAAIDLVTRPRRLARWRAPLRELYGGLAELCRPRVLTIATAIAVPAWACECVGFAQIVDAFPGAHVALGLAIAIYAATTIAGALSFLPGGLGVTESTMALALVHGAVGVDRALAVDATLLTRLATLWFAVVLGVGCLALARRRVRILARRTGAERRERDGLTA